MNKEMQIMRKENHSLKMKMEFETRNNAVLMKNIHRMRANYFNNNQGSVAQSSPSVYTEQVRNSQIGGMNQDVSAVEPSSVEISSSP